MLPYQIYGLTSITQLSSSSCVDDACKLSVGAEVEICNNLIWPTDGKNNRFYAIPTLAAKWTF
ncbi:MAG: DUF5020 family protein [Bacteroidaceae bacterium]|nr:DUF5020 family protein [Bacteroidaceae bacterium]